MKRGLEFLFLIVLIANLPFLFAAVTVSPTSQTAEINTLESFSVIVSNTYTDGVAPNNATVTQIVFTLPSGLLFISGSNSSDPSSTFSNTSNTLTWTNSTWVVNLNSQTTFGFSANVTSLGSSSITITSTFANGSTASNTISVTTNDTSSPTVTLNSPANNDEDTDGVLVFDCSATDNYDLDSIALYIWDNSSAEIHKNILATNGLNNQTDFDYTFASDGTYKWNCFANDTSKNFNWASNRTIKISASLASCTPNWDCEEWTNCTDDLQTRTCNDSNSCGSNATKPAESQACVSLCTPEWDCTDWAPVQCPESEEQTRTCVDVNDCNSNSGKPTEERTCTIEKSGSGTILISSIIAIVLIGGGIAAFFYFRNRNPSIPQTPLNQAYSYGSTYGNTQGDNQGYTYKYS